MRVENPPQSWEYHSEDQPRPCPSWSYRIILFCPTQQPLNTCAYLNLNELQLKFSFPVTLATFQVPSSPMRLAY